MRVRVRERLTRWLRLLAREAAVLLCAAALGVGNAAIGARSYLPTMDGNIYAMLPYEGGLFMVLSKNENNSLVHVDNSGKLLNYAATDSDQAYEDLEVSDDTVYAVLDTYSKGTITQELVSLSLSQVPMRVNSLLRLSEIDGGGPDITWSELYLPPGGDPPSALRLTGIDRKGQGYLLYWDMGTGRTELQPVLEGERLFALKYVAEDHYVWIDMDGRAGQSVHGVRQRDLLDGRAETPYHISTCQERVFAADSVTGDIFELLPDGSADLFRTGSDPIGSTGLQYRQMEIFTAYPDEQGQIQIIGLCANGAGSVIAGEDRYLDALDDLELRPYVIWLHSWQAVLMLWAVLAAATETLHAIFCSRRLLVRIALCELLMGVALMASITVVQYFNFRETLLANARQTLQLAGGNFALTLSGRDGMDEMELSSSMESSRQQVAAVMEEQQKEYLVSVVWDDPNGPAIGYDPQVPEGYLVKDVKPRGYLDIITKMLAEEDGASTIRNVRSDCYTEYLYVERFSQAGRAGCVTVSQEEAVMVAETGTFFQRMRPIFAAFPLLFALLIYFTGRLLRPLGAIREALEEFYDCGGGNQMMLDGMPKTELYEVGRVFNQLSIQTRVQLNKLNKINDSYVRLVPECLLRLLRKRDVLSLSAGESVSLEGALMTLIPERAAEDAAGLEALFSPAAEQVAAHRGMIVDYDGSLGAVTAIFPRQSQARDCARQCLHAFDALAFRVMAAVYTERVGFGVFGSERLIVPLAVSGKLIRRREVLARLNDFGAVLVQSGDAEGRSQRLLGWDDALPYYEDTAYRPSAWQAQWRDAAAAWSEAMERFRAADFAAAMRKFARVLRTVPDDSAARWYLFRCDALRDRDGAAGEPDTGLLSDWRVGNG